MTLPPITNQQQAILRLIYKYRFLDRTQIQKLLGHNDKKRSIAWLKDLRDKQYVSWIYDGHNFAEKIKPAVYFLNLNGVRYLRTLKQFPAAELRKRYRESSRQPDFITRCRLLADCCLNLETQSKLIDGLKYSTIIAADYADPASNYHFLSELSPPLCFVKQQTTPGEVIVTNYLLEVFDATTPRYMVKKRLKDYVEYLADGDWERATGEAKSPNALLACPTTAELIYAKRRTRRLLEDSGDDNNIHIRFATVQQIRLHGITGKIWEEV